MATLSKDDVKVILVDNIKKIEDIILEKRELYNEINEYNDADTVFSKYGGLEDLVDALHSLEAAANSLRALI